MSLNNYNRQQLLEALKHSDSSENIQAYHESEDSKPNPSIKTLTEFYLQRNAEAFYDKNQILMNLDEPSSS